MEDLSEVEILPLPLLLGLRTAPAESENPFSESLGLPRFCGHQISPSPRSRADPEPRSNHYWRSSA